MQHVSSHEMMSLDFVVFVVEVVLRYVVVALVVFVLKMMEYCWCLVVLVLERMVG